MQAADVIEEIYQRGGLGQGKAASMRRDQLLALQEQNPQQYLKVVDFLLQPVIKGERMPAVLSQDDYLLLRSVHDPVTQAMLQEENAAIQRKEAGASLVEESLPFTSEGKGQKDYPAMTELGARLAEGEEVGPGTMLKGFATDIVTRPLRGAREAFFGVPMEQYQTQGSNMLSTIGLNMMVDPTILAAGPIGRGAKGLSALAGGGKLTQGVTTGALAGLAESGIDATTRDVRGMEEATIGDFAIGTLVPAGVGAFGAGSLSRSIRGGREAQREALRKAQQEFAEQQRRTAGVQPEVPTIARADMEPAQFAKAVEAEDAAALQLQTPPGMSVSDVQKLPTPVRRWLPQATDQDYQFMDEARRAWKRNKAGGESGFSWLANTKGKEAFDIFENKMSSVGDEIQQVRKEVIPKIQRFSREELTDLDVFGDVTFARADDGKFELLDELGDVVEKADINDAQKMVLDRLNNGDTMTGVQLKTMRDGLRDRIYDSDGSIKKEAPASLKRLYKGLNNLLDAKVEATAGGDVANNFKRNRAAFSIMMKQDAMLRSKFGELVDVQDVDKILDDVPDPKAYAIREKMSQRLKTMSQNQDAWQGAAETLENVSGMPWRKYADLTRGMGILEGVESASSLKETQAQIVKATERTAKASEEFMPKIVQAPFKAFKSATEYLSTLADKSPYEALQAARLGGELPFYLRPYVQSTAEKAEGAARGLLPYVQPAYQGSGE